MKTKKTIIVAMLMNVVSAFARESTQVVYHQNNDFINSGKQLTFKRKLQAKELLFITNTNLYLGNQKDWNESEVSGSGFFLNFGMHVMPTIYLNNNYKTGDPRFKTGYDFEIGNFFRFAKLNDDRLGIGLRATWLSFGFAKTTLSKDIYRVAQICPLKVGPEFAIAFNETMGLDVFYQLGYNLTEVFGSIDSPGNAKKIGSSSTYNGLSHDLGAAFHYKVYSLGLSYRFGSLKNTMNVYDGKDLGSGSLKKDKVFVNNFMVTLGLRF